MKTWIKPILKATAVVLAVGGLAVVAVVASVLWMVSQLPH